MEMNAVDLEEFEYQGQKVVIHTFPEGKKWGWWFRIGEEPSVELKKSPSADESEALAEARSAACSVLDLRTGIV